MDRGKVSDVWIRSGSRPQTCSAFQVCEICCELGNPTDILPQSSFQSGRYHRHSIELTGTRSSSAFQSCLDGLRLARKMFQDTIGSGSISISEPIQHLRRGVGIRIVAPKVPACHQASTAVDCSEVIEVGSFSRTCKTASEIRYAFLTSSACVIEMLNTPSGEGKYPGTLCRLAILSTLNSIFVQLR